jgi:hypothetical protein
MYPPHSDYYSAKAKRKDAGKEVSEIEEHIYDFIHTAERFCCICHGFSVHGRRVTHFATRMKTQ